MNIFTKALRNNYLPAFILGILISISASAQVDTSGKVRQHINAYGFAYKNISIDSSLRIPRDTFHLRYSDTGSIAIVSNILYTWNGLKWNAVAKVVNDSTLIVNGDTVSITASGGVGNTDLGYTASPTNGTVTSSTGTDATIPAADGTNAGLLKPADYNLLQDSVITNVRKTDSIVVYRTKGGTEVFRDTTRSYKGGFGVVQSGYDFRADTTRSTGLPSYYYSDSISNARNLWQLDGSNNLKPKTFSGAYLDITGKTIKSDYLLLAGSAFDSYSSKIVAGGGLNASPLLWKSTYNVVNRIRPSKDNSEWSEMSFDLNPYLQSGFYATTFFLQGLDDSTANFQSYNAKRMRIDAYAGDLILKATPITNSVFLNVATDTLLEAGYGYLNLPKLGGYGNVLVGANDTGRTKRIYIGANLSLSGDTLSATGGGGGGSGTVSNSASANRLAYYSVSGTTVTALAAITGNRALISDANGLPTASSVTNTELGYVSGVTSAIQTQIDGKQPLDADLTSLAAASSTGIYYRSAANTWSLATIGSGLSFTSGTLSATGGGGMAIGSPVTSGTSQSVLYVDGSGNLAQDNSHFKYNATSKLFSVDSASMSSIEVGGKVFVNGFTGINIPAGNSDAGSIVLVGSSSTTTGSRNTAVGKNALGALGSGYNNTAVGASALGSLASISAENNAFGNISGNSITSGTYNLFLGGSAGYGYTSGNNGVFVGHHTTPIYTSGNNGQLNINGAIWGLNTGWNATSPRIGIGVFSSSYPPLWTLHINGSFGANKDSIPHITSAANYETLVIDTTTGQFSRITTPAGGGSLSLTTTGTSGAATYSGGVLNVPQYLSAGDRSFFDSTKAGQIYDSLEVSLVNSQDVYLKRKSYGSSTWDSAFQFTIPNTSAWDSVIRTTLTTTSVGADFSNAALSRIVNVPNGTIGTIRFEASANDGAGKFYSDIIFLHYSKTTGGTLSIYTGTSSPGTVNVGLPSETGITVANVGDNLAFKVSTGTVTAAADVYWKLNICLTSNSGASF